MARSIKKGPYINEKLLKKLSQLKSGDKTVIKTWDRASTITPEMVGFRIGVHNGKEHVNVDIVENMVGHRLGEFVPTRKFFSHGGKMAKAQQKEAGEATTATATPTATAAPAKNIK